MLISKLESLQEAPFTPLQQDTLQHFSLVTAQRCYSCQGWSHTNLNMHMLVTVGGHGGCGFILGFFTWREALAGIALLCQLVSLRGEQDVWQNQTSGLSLSHLWGWSEQLISHSAEGQALEKVQERAASLPPQLWPLPHWKRPHHQF